MGRLDNKVAIITGAAAGMGAEHARLFVEEGAKVVITTDMNIQGGEALAAELGGSTLFLKHDVSDPGSWTSVVAEATEKLGPITVLVNNAGLSGPAAQAVDLSVEDFDRIVAVDQRGTFLGMQAVLPGMIEAGGGSIVNIGSAAAFAHLPWTTNMGYTGAKFAVRGMTKATAIEYAAKGVRVNSVHPGAIMTPMAQVYDKAVLDEFASTVPIRRFGEPREVSYAVLYLASDESSYVTGTELVVDGGRLAE